MSRREGTVAAPARTRVGLPIVADGSARHPLLLALAGPADEGACNNGCPTCVTRPIATASAPDVRGRHVVIRHREATLRRDLPARIRGFVDGGAASVALVTNGRLLVYADRVAALARAGLARVIVKLFGTDAAAHDHHARVDGAYAQAVAGIAVARAHGGIEVLVAFPHAGPEAHAACIALARALTDRDPVRLPEPEVLGHANEYRYDLVALRADAAPPWTTSYFPMVHLNTGPLCNIRCVYCNVRGGTDQRLFDAAYVLQLLDDAAGRVLAAAGQPTPAPGRPTIDFIGGEPTMHPELPRLIRAARARGFAQVFICTNGVRLARPGYLDELIAAGLTGVRLSFHDHRPAVANALADVPGLDATYPEVAAMLLARADVHTHLFRILLADTIDALPDYLRWLAAHNRTGRPIDLTLGMPSLRGRLFDAPGLYPALGQLRPAVAAAMALAGELGFAPLIHHAPACLWPAAPDRAACVNVVTTQVDAIADTTTVMNFEGDAVHGAACARCPAKARGCAGLPRAYFDQDAAAAEAWLAPVAR
jgi:molybdenum cofactor biosynthesis enzyme MoaA